MRFAPAAYSRCALGIVRLTSVTTPPPAQHERALQAISRRLLEVSGWLIIAIVILIISDIGSRTLLHVPLRGVPELVSLSIPIIVFLALGYLFSHGQLIQSDVLLGSLRARSRHTAAALQFSYHLIGAGVALSIAALSGRALHSAIGRAEFIGVEGDFTAPVWPTKLALTLGALMLGTLCLCRAYAFIPGVRERRSLRWFAAVAGVVGVVLTSALLLGDSESRSTAGAIAIIVMFVLIYAGMPVAFALATAAVLGILSITGDARVAIAALGLVADGAVSDYVFAAVPLFVLMGLVVGAADIGRDSLQACHWLLRRVRGGLGVATVAANGIFAAITGISIASAAIFSRVAVPPLIQHGFTPRFAVGLVAGSSVLGMLIPPSLLLIIYGLVAEVSISRLFRAAVIPGLLLTIAYAAGVIVVSIFRVSFAVGGTTALPSGTMMTGRSALKKSLPIIFLIGIVLGGIYGGIFTPTEAGAVGAFAAIVLALTMKRVSLRSLLNLVFEAAGNSASILFLIVTASAFAIMLSLSEIPAHLSAQVADHGFELTAYACAYLVVLILLGMVLDSTSILLIMVPLALPIVQALGGDLVWFGIISVIGVEIGLLTPPLGLSVYAIKASLPDQSISLNDIFVGALPFALIMLALLMLLVFFPQLATAP